jgi:putative oxidoreductase
MRETTSHRSRLRPDFLRIIAGLIVFPFGMQKLVGWFGGGPGIGGTLKDLDFRRIPRSIARLIIIG